MSIFYVYEHWRPDTNVCFYVGKGKLARAWDFAARNIYYKRIRNKLRESGLKIDVRIIKDNLSADDAFALEIERIAVYGVHNLANCTLGGDGLSNPTQETCDKISKAHKARWSDPDHKDRMVSMLEAGKKNMPVEARLARAAKIGAAHLGKKVSNETRANMRAAAKARGMHPATRAAQKAAVTGVKRAPFKPETIAKMKIAASKREDAKRDARFLLGVERVAQFMSSLQPDDESVLESMI